MNDEIPANDSRQDHQAVDQIVPSSTSLSDEGTLGRRRRLPDQNGSWALFVDAFETVRRLRAHILGYIGSRV